MTKEEVFADMEMWEIKLTLLRSNPSLIRQFTVPGSFTFGQLDQVIRLLLGWSEERECLFWADKNRFGREQTLDSVLEAEKPVFYQSGDKKNGWTFRISVLGKVEQQEGVPRMERHRGDNPPPDCRDVKQFNGLQRSWEYSGMYFYGYDAFAMQHPRKSYIFSADRVNRMLRSMVRSGEKGVSAPLLPTLNYQDAEEGREILAEKTVAELKAVALLTGRRLPSNLRKDDIIVRLTEHLGSWKVLDSVLEFMTVGEYRVFQRICAGKAEWGTGNTDDVAERLISYGYVGREIDPYGYMPVEVQYCVELLDAYDAWLNEGREEAFLEKALLRTALKASLDLYGYLSCEEWLKLASGWFLDKYEEKELRTVWKKAALFLRKKEYETSDSEFYFCLRYMDRKDALSLSKQLEQMPVYVPKLEELKRLDEEGLRLPQKEEQELRNCLTRQCMVQEDEVDWFLRQFCKGLSCGADSASICDWFSRQRYLRSKKALGAVAQILDRARENVRQMVLRGYTPREWENVTRVEPRRMVQKKVYPNAPCPCGSGKKYKFCCGRK